MSLLATTLSATAGAEEGALDHPWLIAPPAAFSCGWATPGEDGGTIEAGGQWGHVYFNTHPRRVLIEWRPAPTLGFPPDFGDLTSSTRPPQHDQTFETDFAPTAVEVVDHATMYVAGSLPDGGAVVERWTLAWPVETERRGSSETELVVPERAEVKRVHARRSRELGAIHTLTAVRRRDGSTRSLLLGFDDASEVHELDLASGEARVLASTVAGHGRLSAIPELADAAYRRVLAGHRPGWGYVYLFTTDRRPWCDVIVLRDADRDGSLESFLVVRADDFWGPGGWNDRGTYAELGPR